MLKIFKYLRYGKEQIKSRKCLFTSAKHVSVAYYTNWGNNIFARADVIGGVKYYVSVDKDHDSELLRGIVLEMTKSPIIPKIMAAYEDRDTAVKLANKKQSLLFKMNRRSLTGDRGIAFRLQEEIAVISKAKDFAEMKILAFKKEIK